ncbi:MAG: glycosyltransferase [Lachnospiraceae bacterium]|nr:glycosyltransferase [Lachnospiraceae bacterium]
MAEHQPISICIITKNESDLLRQCLERLAPIAEKYGHEIVVTDTGSTDDTLPLCHSFGVSLYEFQWIDDFAAARNYAADHAKNDWILCVDSDEFITKWDEEKIQRSIAENPKGIGSIRLILTCGFGRNQYQAWGKVYRLYHRKLYRFEKPIHEQLVPIIVGLKRHFFDVEIEGEHFSYAKTPEELSVKSYRNIRLLEKELEKDPHDPYVLFQLGQSYYMMEEFDKALYYYDLGLAEDVDPRLDYVHTMVVSYGYTLVNLKQYEKALDLEGIYDVFGTRADFVFLMGMIYLNNGFFQDAIAQFERATTFDQAEVIGTNSFRAWYNLGVIYECSGQTEKALSYYTKCGDFPPAKERIALLKQS